MTPVEFKEVNTRVAENQPEYITLPAFADYSHGTVTSCWELSPAEIARIVETKQIWVQQQNFCQPGFFPPLQPIQLSVQKDDLIAYLGHKVDDDETIVHDAEIIPDSEKE